MRKIAGAVSAVALVSAAVLICSKTLLATQAVGMGVVDERAGAQSAAAKVAYRFPAGSEQFLDFIPPSAATAAATHEMKADRLPDDACPSLFSPAPTADCLAAGGKPVPPARPMPAVEQRATKIAAEPRTMTVAAERVAAATPVTAAAPVRASAAVPPASCAHNLATANARVERVLARIKDARTRQGADACAAYRSDFFAVVQAREVTALCKSGAERDRDLGRIDGAVEHINGAIALSCGT
jgi:hypothetical protein